ncbi:uncharacterized protein TRIADDRAFT_57087 [Trichoplax adhaerens]|uniref:Centrosomal protein CCDC61 n=1 Tax=Trichoplax adhaerens TaxID=10228 RepID=B3S0K9_TRIAD|nr:hypothetical protein TRIADDRAFT_57087 [Trichoplax adhaerens]EDV23658.1 hypothetical protein TRIADDRAFT_57087 [Trichoplax adhaerens]|eukprot:XP_002113184.1 hypothetical protein TRIADDRAFT_57087 [Trichoplax adhaerens]
MRAPNYVVVNYVFRDTEHSISLEIDDNLLVIEIEEKATLDQWHGEFDVEYVEELTRKTGNFKQFPIFVNMLKSALLKSSDSVSLDLLTYTDLELLRNRKLGINTANTSHPPSTSLANKRYIILTYTVEFDRIHYPLPLRYQGKPDPALLQETIRNLREENRQLQAKTNRSSSYRNSDVIKMQKQIDKLKQEKEEIEEAFIEYRREIESTSKADITKEIKVLKKIIKNLEQELLKEKSRHHHVSNKRSKEYRSLMEEIEALRSSERNLRVRCKSLSNELALLKNDRRRSIPSKSRSRTHSRDNSVPRNTSRSRASVSVERHTPKISNVSRRKNWSPSPSGKPQSITKLLTSFCEMELDTQDLIRLRIPFSRYDSYQHDIYASLWSCVAISNSRRVSQKQGEYRPPRSRSNSYERPHRSSSLPRQQSGVRSRNSSVASSSSRASRGSVGTNSDHSFRGLRNKSVERHKNRSSTPQRSKADYSRKVNKKNKDSMSRRVTESNNIEKSANMSDIDARLAALQSFLYTRQSNSSR